MQLHRLANHAGSAPRSHPFQSSCMSLPVSFRHEQRKALAEDLCFRIAKDDLRPLVPGKNVSLFVG